jgi:hypothetical protein
MVPMAKSCPPCETNLVTFNVPANVPPLRIVPVMGWVIDVVRLTAVNDFAGLALATLITGVKAKDATRAKAMAKRCFFIFLIFNG